MPKSKLSFKQGQREFSHEEIEQIQQTFKRFPSLSRYELAGTVCEHLNWLTPAGLPKDRACMQLFYQMENHGLIKIPARRAGGSVSKPIVFTSRTEQPATINLSLKEISPVHLITIRDKEAQVLWNEYIERYHPLGYKRPTGYTMRYFIQAQGHYLGCLLLSGAARALSPRDKWIGWSAEQRKANISWIVNNARYLIFPWVKIPHLASHVLGQLARYVVDDWEEYWGFRPLLLETFVDPLYYSGICYQAAGWEMLGKTTGRGLARPGKIYKSSPKLIYIKPLSKQCQLLLCSNLKGRTEL